MAYVGITNGEDKGLYDFSSVKMAERIVELVSDSILYTNPNKDKALQEMNVSEKDIKDGYILIVKNHLDDAKGFVSKELYLVIQDTKFGGVYLFKSPRKAEEYHKNFENSEIFNDMNQAVDNFSKRTNIVKENIIVFDASELMREMRIKVKDKPKTEVSKKIVEKKVVSEMNTTNQISSFKDIINHFIDDYNVIEITMSTGEVIRFAMRSILYLNNGVSVEGLVRMDTDKDAIICEDKVNALTKSNSIIILGKSNYKENGNFVTLTNCDDAYSPNIEVLGNNMTNYNHGLDKIMINLLQIATIKGSEGYSDLTLSQITKDKYNLLYKYLVKAI